MNILSFAKDHSINGEIQGRYSDIMVTGKKVGDPNIHLTKMLAYADMTCFTDDEGNTVNNTGSDGIAVLSESHCAPFSACVSTNLFTSLDLALERITHADLLVSGKEMESPIPQIRNTAITQELGRDNWFFVMDTERAAIHYKQEGDTFELCFFDWAWIAGSMNI